MGIDAQLLSGMGLQGRLGVSHHLRGQLGSQVGLEPAPFVDGGQLPTLTLGLLMEGVPFDA